MKREGKTHRFLVTNRVCNFTYVAFHGNVGKINGIDVLRGAVKALWFMTHTVLTDRGLDFTDPS